MRVLLILLIVVGCSAPQKDKNQSKTELNDTPDKFAKSIISSFNENNFELFYQNFITESDYDYIMSKSDFDSKKWADMQKSLKRNIVEGNRKQNENYFSNCHFKNLTFDESKYRLKKNKKGLLFIKDFKILAKDKNEPVTIVFSELVKIDSVWKSKSDFKVE